MPGICASHISHPFLCRWSMFPRGIRRRCLSHSSKIYETPLRVCREQLDLDLVTDIHAFLAAHESSLYWRILYTHVGPTRLFAGYDRLEPLANSVAEQNRRGDLSDITLDFARGVFLYGAVAGDRRELIVGIRRRIFGEDRFQNALRHQVRVATVGRRRVSVILHRQTEVAGLLDARLVENIFPRPEKLHDSQGQIGEVTRVRRFALEHEIVEG